MLPSTEAVTLLLAALALCSICLFALAPTRYAETNGRGNARKSKRDGKKAVQIVVLGDIGRSPRMQYHAISLAKHDVRVDLTGFRDSDIHPDLHSRRNVNIVPIPSPPRLFQTSNRLLFLVLGPIKALVQSLTLFHCLAYRTLPARWILVQNPPSIPVLAVATCVAYLRNSQLVIDWHNFGWSVLALKLGNGHILVKISRLYEAVFGRMAHAHFCVTRAMADYLQRTLSVSALTLHDRPTKNFQALNPSQRATFLETLEQTAPFAAELKTKSRRLVVSSTSWTQDEDFSILLDALVRYSKSEASASGTTLPSILAVITGKGPQKQHYLAQIEQLTSRGELSRATIVTAWLHTEEYAALLGAADVGVSLHKSTSGVDLPMKVVDMFGAGLPVVGWDGYGSWPELVTEGVNGRGFRDAVQLERLFVELFAGGGEELDRLRKGVLEEGRWRWDDEWDSVAGRKVFDVA